MPDRKTLLALVASALLLPLVPPAQAQGEFGATESLPDALMTKDGVSIAVRLVYGSEREKAARDRFASVLAKHNLKPWIFTQEVLFTEEGFPHSHPVLTLTTYDEDPLRQLSSFIHEQLHWYEEASENKEAINRAIEDLKEMYPDPPSHEEIGTRSEESTYLHLIIGWQVLDALTQLSSEETARRIQSAKDHYEWVYRQVLSDTDAIGEVAAEHGLIVTPNEGLVPRTER